MGPVWGNFEAQKTIKMQNIYVFCKYVYWHIKHKKNIMSISIQNIDACIFYSCNGSHNKLYISAMTYK